MNQSEQQFWTGGIGSFGKKFVEIMLKGYKPKPLVIFSRDELEQHDIRVSGIDHPSLRDFIGNVRDLGPTGAGFRTRHRGPWGGAEAGSSLREQPVRGYTDRHHDGRNVIDAAIDQGIQRILALSTDEGESNQSVRGYEAVSRKDVRAGQCLCGSATDSRQTCVRYGNVVGSRGSVISLFLEQRKRGRITVNHSRMTRFWLTLEHGVRFVVRSIEQMHGGEIFVPKIPSTRPVDPAEAVALGCAVEHIGIRPGEKLHELLLSEDEAPMRWISTRYSSSGRHILVEDWKLGSRPVLPQGFGYTSGSHEQWLSHEQLHELIEPRAAQKSPVPA